MLEFYVSNEILARAEKSTLSRTKVIQMHKAFSEGCEIENLPHASRSSISVNDDKIGKEKKEIAEDLNISYRSTQ